MKGLTEQRSVLEGGAKLRSKVIQAMMYVEPKPQETTVQARFLIHNGRE
jgi:hypothetical protein